MGGYGKQERLAPAVQMHMNAPDLGQIGTAIVHPKKETVTSYRSRQKGTYVPDHEADPYAYFLRESTERKKESAIDRNRSSKSVTPTMAPTNFLVGASHKPHSDNGHSFLKTELSLGTNANRTDNFWYAGDSQYDKRIYGGPLVAQGASLSILGVPHKLFDFQQGSIDDRNTFAGCRNWIDEPEFDAKYYGQKAIASLSPNRPGMSLATFIGELRERLPTVASIALLKEGKNIHKGLSKEYVNHQFGSMPMLRDIASIIRTLKEATETLLQYERDAGNGVRRTMSFPVIDDKVSFSGPQIAYSGTVGLALEAYPAYKAGTLPNNTAGSIGGWNGPRRTETILTQRVQKEIWFSGSFTYYVRQGSTLADHYERYIVEAERLFGKVLTFETLWALSPWSWLADWLFDIDTTISAYERIQDENLVINYGYLMATTKRVATQETSLSLANGFPASMRNFRTTVTSLRKQRIRANPYGFAMTSPSSLSAEQLSILAAIGITRM